MNRCCPLILWTNSPGYETRKVDYRYPADGLNRQSMTDNGVVTSYGRHAVDGPFHAAPQPVIHKKRPEGPG